MTLISIVIPTVPDKLNVKLLQKAVNSLFLYKDAKHEYDLIIVGNNWEGFSVPVNQGIKMARGDFILVMNDDVEIRGNGWEDIMLEPFQDKTIGIVGHYQSVQHGKYSALWFTMIKREVFDKVGLLNEELSLFSQDIHLGFKAQQEGYITAFVSPPVIHKWSQTVGRLPDQETMKDDAKKIFEALTGVDHDSA